MSDAVPPIRRSRKKSKADRTSKRSANIELSKAARLLKNIRACFVVFAVLNGLFFVLFALGYQAAEGNLAPDVETYLIAIIAVFAGVTLFCVAGSLYLLRNPWAWTLALACLLSLQCVLVLLDGFTSAHDFVFPILTLAAWCSLSLVKGTKQLLLEHGDSLAAQKILGHERELRSADTIGAAKRERMRLREQRNNNKVIYYALAGVLLLIVSLVVINNLPSGSQRGNRVHAKEPARAPDHKPYMRRFEAAWNSSSRKAIGRLASTIGNEKEVVLEMLETRLKRHDITDKFPRLSDHNALFIPSDNPQKIKAYWSIPTARVRTLWRHYDGDWRLTAITFRKPKRN